MPQERLVRCMRAPAERRTVEELERGHESVLGNFPRPKPDPSMKVMLRGGRGHHASRTARTLHESARGKTNSGGAGTRPRVRIRERPEAKTRSVHESDASRRKRTSYPKNGSYVA